MNRLFLATTILFSAAGSALAADAVVYDAAPEAPVYSVYDWSGAYIGLHGGGAWGEVDYSVDPSSPVGPIPDESFDVDGYLLGAQAGYNFQSGNLVFGVEGDISWADIDGEGDPLDPTAVSPTVASFDVDWVGTVRGRLGYAMDRFLVYGTGGVAFAGVTGNVSNVEGSGDDRDDDSTYTGWTIGAGAEYAVTDMISLKAEYQYADFGSEDFNFGDVGGAGDLLAEGDLQMHMVKVGFNVNF